jgi:hypothetical protein
MQWRILALATLALLGIFNATSASAGFVVQKPLTVQQQVVVDAALRERLPFLEPWRENSEQRDCAGRQDEPRLHALLIGLDYAGSERLSELDGTHNDVKLMIDTLNRRDIAPEDLHVITGASTMRAEALSAMSELISCVGENDQIVLYFAGISGNLPVLPSDEAISAACREVIGAASATCEDAVRDGLDLNRADHSEYLFGLRADLAEARGTMLVLGERADGGYEALTGTDLASFGMAVRQRGASIFFVFDGCSAEGLELGPRQSDLLLWRGSATPNGFQNHNPRTRRGGGIGEYAVFYASAVEGNAVEEQFDSADGTVTHGVFTFALAQALQTEERLSVSRLAELTADTFYALKENDTNIENWPRFEASDPDMALLAAELPLSGDAVEIDNPPRTRGGDSYIVAGDEVEISGRVERDVEYLLVDNELVQVDASGHFSRTIALDGRTRVAVLVYSRGEFIKQELTFSFDGDVEGIVGQGRRYALIIGNQTYEDDSFTDLKFPIADARAVADILRQRYGYATNIEVDRETIELMLEDATRDRIDEVLTRLTEALGEKDTLLVYYAGHGVWDETTGFSAWLPVDAKRGRRGTMFTGDLLQDYIVAIKAHKVLVVSDSCYAGQLFRAEDAGLPTADNRREAILKLARPRSRVFLAAGNREPVQDGGGWNGSNSVFSAAFISGLQRMEDDIFSAQQLYVDIIQPMTAGAFQRPQWSPLLESGHEDGDFLFARVRTAAEVAAVQD